VVIIDLPDPNHVGLGKLYTEEFYTLLKKRMAAGGTLVTQSTSPYYAPKAFWCIHKSLQSVFPETLPYTVLVPSFGQWGFNLAIQSPGSLKPGIQDSISLTDQAIALLEQRLFLAPDSLQLTFFKPGMLRGLFLFDGDTQPVEVEVNQLHNQVLVQYYEESWAQW
jgi:spermidine synthase